MKLKRFERRIWQDFNVLRAKHRVKYKNTCYQQWHILFLSRGAIREAIVDKIQHSRNLYAFRSVFVGVGDLIKLSSRSRSLSRSIRYGIARHILLLLKSIIHTHTRVAEILIRNKEARVRRRTLSALGNLIRQRLYALKMISRNYQNVFKSWQGILLYQRVQLVVHKSVFSCWRTNSIVHSHLNHLQSRTCATRALQDMRLLYTAMYHDRRRIISVYFSHITRSFHSSRMRLFFRLWIIRSLQSVALSHRACIRRVLLGWNAYSCRMRSLEERLDSTRRQQSVRTQRVFFQILIHSFRYHHKLRSTTNNNRARHILTFLCQSVVHARILARRSSVLSARLQQTHRLSFFRSWILAANVERLFGRSIRTNLHALIHVLRIAVSMRIRKRILLFRAVRFRSNNVLRRVGTVWAQFTQRKRVLEGGGYAQVGQKHAAWRAWNSWCIARPQLRHRRFRISQMVSERSREIVIMAFQIFVVYVKDKCTEGTRLTLPSRQVCEVRSGRLFSRWKVTIERVIVSRADREKKSCILIAKRLKLFFGRWLQETRIFGEMNKRGHKLLIRQSVKRWLKVAHQKKRFSKLVFRGIRLKMLLAWIVGVERGLGLKQRSVNVEGRRITRWFSSWKERVNVSRQLSIVHKSYTQSTERRTVNAWKMVILNKKMVRLKVQKLRYEKKANVFQNILREATRMVVGRVEKTRVCRENLLRETVLSWSKLTRSKMRSDLRQVRNSFRKWRSWLSEQSVTSRSTTPGLEIAQVSHCAVPSTQQVTIDEVVSRLFRIKQKISILGSID